MCWLDAVLARSVPASSRADLDACYDTLARGVCAALGGGGGEQSGGGRLPPRSSQLSPLARSLLPAAASGPEAVRNELTRRCRALLPDLLERSMYTLRALLVVEEEEQGGGAGR